VNVTPFCPYNEDPASDEVTDVKLVALLTVCPPDNVPLLVTKSPSPLYAAVTV
jgi:hypothetical protein